MFIPLDIEEEGKKYLIDKGYHIKIATNVMKETLMKEVRDCDAILTRSNATIDADVIKAGNNVSIISKYGVGLNNIDVEVATEQGIYVANTPEANADVVAEHVMALILTLSKQIMTMDKALKKGDFDIRSKVYSDDLNGKILGILGLGRIGRLVAEKAYQGFNMRIVGYDPFANEQPSYIEQIDTLEEVLQVADYISLHFPLLESTKHLIGPEQFKQMKQTAYLINASRGGTVEENALVYALKNNEIAGAGIDVFEIEPPDTTHELFSMDNIIVTPHSAALSKEGAVRMSVHAAMQVDQVLQGKLPSWPVNKVQK